MLKFGWSDDSTICMGAWWFLRFYNLCYHPLTRPGIISNFFPLITAEVISKEWQTQSGAYHQGYSTASINMVKLRLLDTSINGLILVLHWIFAGLETFNQDLHRWRHKKHACLCAEQKGKMSCFTFEAGRSAAIVQSFVLFHLTFHFHPACSPSASSHIIGWLFL